MASQLNQQAWLLTQLADWANAQLIGTETTVTGFSTDSRSTQPGDCYIAIVGDKFDGHQFIAQAIENGAKAVMISQPCEFSVPQLLVKDTRLALGHLAHHHRLSQAQVAVIAVTGSNGKTTVKSMLAHCLQRIAPTWATPGNLNNDFGVPRTLLQITNQHRYAVIEMGANHRKEIDYLSRMAQPNIALITLAADAHLEGFGSLQGVIDTKGEIFNGLQSGGVGVINTDSPGYAQWASQLKSQSFLTFGRQPQADVRVESVKQTSAGLQVGLCLNQQSDTFTMPILGVHNAMNAAAVCAVCLALDLPWSEIKAGLESFSGVGGRLQTHVLANGMLIDDSYNANPGSVKAGIDTLAELDGYKVLCLGAMAELGETTAQAHADVGRYAAERGIDSVYGYGEATQASLNAFAAEKSQPAMSIMRHQQMIEQIQLLLAEQGEQPIHILIKGSRSAQMEQVVNAIIKGEQNAHLS